MKFQIYRDVDRQWRWRLVAGNNRVLADGGEGYHNKGDCIKDVALVRHATTDTPIEELDEATQKWALI